MDPPMVINDPSFSPSRCSAELWHFPNSGAGGIGLRMPSSLISGFHAPSALSLDESTLTHQTAGTPSGRNKRKPTPITPQDHTSRLVSTTTTADHLNNESAKRPKASAVGEENHDNCSNAERETSSQSNTKPEPPKDYIHVRARRGQATDSHSLAERARREKISERMKILQDLVPGCNKVIGKALVLDEIINYVQSLQRQVEFLSMKLEAVNSRMKPTIEGFPSKDLAAPSFDASALIFSQQEPREYAQVTLPEWLHVQFGSRFGRAT